MDGGGYTLPLADTAAVPEITLRGYQDESVKAIRQAFGKYKRICFVLPTGGGKTICFAHIAAQAAKKGNTVIIVAHRRRIVTQISRTLTLFGVEHGLIVAGQPLTDHRVQVGMIQTIGNRLDKIPEPALLVCDECHHSPAGTWKKVADRWQKARKLGVSATPERLDGKGLRPEFDFMVVGPSAAELIEAGALSDYQYYAPPSNLDLSSVHVRAGEYVSKELMEAMEASSIMGDAVKHYTTHLAGKPAIAFCVTVDHAKAVAEAFRSAGYKAAHIHGKMPPALQEELITKLGDGRLQVLAACELISEGVDIPNIQGVILLRPTKSLALWLQQVGRALRPNPDGSHSIILDHVGSVHKFGMPDFPRKWSLDGRKKKISAPDVTTCKLCFKTMPAIVVRGPSWDCAGVDTDVCPYSEEREKMPRSLPEEVGGELEKVENIAPDGVEVTRPKWAGGIALETARGKYWFLLLEAAGTDPERLEEIREARGYKSGWVKHQMAKQYAIDAEVNAFVEGGHMPSVSEISTEAIWPMIRAIIDMEDGTPGECWSAWISDLRAEYNLRKQRVA